MGVSERLPGGCVPSRCVLCGLLMFAAFVHLARLRGFPDAADAAAHAGSAAAYAVIAAMVLLGERWAYLAAALLPAIGQLLGDYRSFAVYGNPIEALDPIVDLLIVPVALYVLWAVGRPEPGAEPRLPVRAGAAPGGLRSGRARARGRTWRRATRTS